MLYWTDFGTERIKHDFAKAALHPFQSYTADLHVFPIIADQHAFVVAEVVEVEKVVQTSASLRISPRTTT